MAKPQKSKAVLKFVLFAFVVWRVALFVIAYVGTLVLPNFGARFPYAESVLIPTGLPSWIWGFGNFDGVHYLRIAQNGYAYDFTQAFFPMYPYLIRIFDILPKNPSFDPEIFVDPTYFYVAFVLTNALFIGFLYFFYKLVANIYSEKTAYLSTIFLLLFSTSFYFGSIYSESLFLFLSILSLWFLNKKNFLLSGVFAALASATRIFGAFLLLVIVIEYYLDLKKRKFKFEKKDALSILGILLAPLGMLIYMFYLKQSFGDALYFLHAQPAFGAGRVDNTIILLPQVLYRYAKILITVPVTTLAFLNASLELIFTMLGIFVLVVSFRKIKLSYWIFMLCCFLLPTLTGTLSSMPRYILVMFLAIPFVVERYQKYYKPLVIIFALIGIVLTIMFTRGYWVA